MQIYLVLRSDEQLSFVEIDGRLVPVTAESLERLLLERARRHASAAAS